MGAKRVVPLDEVRRLVADYMASEGCSCCRSIDKHRENTEALGKLLKVKPYSDGSGFNFAPFRTPEKP